MGRECRRPLSILQNAYRPVSYRRMRGTVEACANFRLLLLGLANKCIIALENYSAPLLYPIFIVFHFLQDLPTGADSCITSLDSDGRHLLVAGCGDGTVRLYDRRLPPHETRVLTYREHTGWVVKARMRRGADRIISADASGM